MRKSFVAGNWKMHGSNAMIESLLSDLQVNKDALKGVEVAVCPPFIYLEAVKAKLLGNSLGSSIKVGAQNVASVSGQGAYTGEISVDMLKDIGCEYVIVGHSERRSLYGETDEIVAEKVEAVINAGLTPLLCVGETLEEREKNVTEEVVARQLVVVVDKVGVRAFENIVVAYEPVWAIGTGKTATPEQAQNVHAFIRGLIAQKDTVVASNLIIQYGGSVKPDNAAILFSQPDIDGGLIGGASLVADDFLAICKAAGEACSE